MFDLLVANWRSTRIGRRVGGEGFDDDTPYTPAWQERITGVPRAQLISVAREFAENAHKTHGRSMVIIGAAMNHWYHGDMNYRGVINMLMMCGCVGQSGGGWAHYVVRKNCGRKLAGLRSRSRSTGFARRGCRTAPASSTRIPISGATKKSALMKCCLHWQTNNAGSVIDYNVRAERMGWCRVRRSTKQSA